MRQPRHLSWSTSTIPSSTRLYMADDGQAETHAGFRQCSQIRGRWNMNVCSNESWTLSTIDARLGSFDAICGEPPRSSSQLGPHVIFMSLPVIALLGRATGICGEFAG